MLESARSAPQGTSSGVELPLPESDVRTRFGGRFTFSESLRDRAARGMLISASFTIGLGVLGMVKGFILAGFLSRADYGVWGILVVSLSTLVWFKQAGIGDKFVQQDEVDQELAFQRAFTLEVLATVACVLLIAAAVPGVIAIYHLPKLAAPCAVIAGTLLVSVFQAPLWIYYRRMEFGRQRALQAVDPVVGFVVSIALAVAGAGYWAFVGGFAAGACSASAAAAWASPFRLRLRFDRRTLRSYWRFSGPLLLTGGAWFVLSWSATIAAKLELGVAAVGVLALADNLAAFSESVDTVVTGSLYPAVCAVKDQLELLYESLVKSNRLALMWAVPFGLGVSLFCSDLVHFGIGERWRPAVVVLQVYGVAAAINHIGFNWTAYLRALDRTRPIAIATIAATVIFLLTGIPLLLVIGLRGFAIGIALQVLAALVMRAYYLERIFPGFDFLRHAARSFVPALIAGSVVLLLRVIEPSDRTLILALGELVVYGLLTALATWYLESSLLREAVGHLLGRREATAVS